MTKILVDSELLKRVAGICASHGYKKAEAELRAALDAPSVLEQEASKNLGELLAVIHCDGGHYAAEHGIAKATADAIAKWAALRTAPKASTTDDLKAAVLAEREVCAKECEALVIGGLPLAHNFNDMDYAAVDCANAIRSRSNHAPTTDDRKDAERWRYIRRHLCLTGNGDGTCQMYALNLPCRIQGWPEIGESLQFHDAAIDAAIAAQKGEKE